MPVEVDPIERMREVTEAAHALICEGGLDAVTVRALAARLDCSTTAVTHYFKNKAEILLATYRHSVARVRRRREENASGGFVGQLEAILPLNAEQREDWLIYIAFWSEALCDPVLKAEQKARNREIVAAVNAHLATADILPEGTSDEARMSVARGIVAALYGIAVQAVFDPERWDAASQRDALSRALATHIPDHS
ncbi:TetR/AcrR family transcriptional regulator [Croceicoccus gelatinilyticus]|uniref:TetR/AcrR family transcriptional regulator n=1 Tax=Croceicoccus gelatinilyticus TaxID=2835536 RepID=UPI001BCDFB2D|nr:TetR/AcrR family transcriptional regulator [Croceicoccus gelatinilyticus]MBS7668722.1 TetR family transcriptional regulator [Croceicoccus gelatinilyticus]